MRLYVAGNFEHDRAKVAEIAHALVGDREENTITFKWWEVLEVGKVQKAMMDQDGVTSADALVVYMKEMRRYQGTWVEVGVALGQGIPVYFIGDAGESCIFRHHPLSRDFYQDFRDRHAVVRVREALR